MHLASQGELTTSMFADYLRWREFLESSDGKLLQDKGTYHALIGILPQVASQGYMMWK
jgi:hypothetical protein